MQECNQCGKCCIAYSDGGLSATAGDIAGWEIFNPALLDYVVKGEIWMDPVSGARLSRCPWLEELSPTAGSGKTSPAAVTYGCRIYHDRPEDCRHYPTAIAEMVRDGCEMLEVRDLLAPREAQITLDRIMADSRPALRAIEWAPVPLKVRV